MYPDDFLQGKLQSRIKDGALRALRIEGNGIDFCSNDYLGIATNHRLQTTDYGLPHGSTGSRLLSGNYPLIETVEKQLAEFHGSEAALLFNSGYDANTGLLSCVPQKGDTVLYDHLCHASIRDGIRLSFARSFSFSHNDLADLETKLKLASGTIFIVTESVFSMDGDLCPLQELVSIAERYGAHLVIDEAHATGVVGQQGEGLVQQLQLEKKIFARVHTFGKACGCHGAVVLGSEHLRQYLVNFARSFVYTTALPAHAVAVISESYRLFPGMQEERRQLQQLGSRFQAAGIGFQKVNSQTPIQGVIVPGNEAAKQLAAKLQQEGFDIRPILYPTVPKGAERLRIVLHSFNTAAQLDKLIGLLR